MTKENKTERIAEEIARVVCDAYAGQIRYLGGNATPEAVYEWAKKKVEDSEETTDN